jgi:tRNA(Arg) A34 adenosine deaminase TadA
MYAGFAEVPSPGLDISAVIAWDVDDPTRTPEFLLDRNRNFDKHGDIFHAESNVLRSAYEELSNLDPPPVVSSNQVAVLARHYLRNAVLYTTLEPCPMCATTITMARVPLAIFCMDDPNLRDITTHETVIEVPTAFYGRALTEDHSELRLCRGANAAMWQAAEQSPPFSFTISGYIHRNREAIFRPAWDALRCYKVQHSENEGLLFSLQEATGDTVPCER